jgi:heterodisulfide reductase subunit B2
VTARSLSTLAYYPGCSLKSSSRFYEESMERVFRFYGIPMEELEDWSCCGALAVRSLDEGLSAVLMARNLALAEERGRNLFAPCSACYNRAKVVTEKIRTDGDLRGLIQDALNPLPCFGSVEVKNILEVLHEYVGVGEIYETRVVELAGLRVVPYYGCVLTRMAGVVPSDDPEIPSTMDRLIMALGAEVIDWPLRTDCCGGSKTVISRETTLSLSSAIMDRALDLGAHAIVTSCPLCQMNLDLLPSLGRKDPCLPVLFITEVFELALFGDLAGARAHMIPTTALRGRIQRLVPSHAD